MEINPIPVPHALKPRDIDIDILYLRRLIGFYNTDFVQLKHNILSQSTPDWCNVHLNPVDTSFLFDSLRKIRDEQNYVDFYLLILEVSNVNLQALCHHVSKLHRDGMILETRGVENSGLKYDTLKIDDPYIISLNHGVLLSKSALLTLAPCHYTGMFLTDINLAHCWHTDRGYNITRNIKYGGSPECEDCITVKNILVLYLWIVKRKQKNF
eukprot:UN22782